MRYIEKCSALRAPFFLSNPSENDVYIEKFYTHCGRDVDENGYFAQVKRMLRWTAGDDVDENGCFTEVQHILRWTAGGDVEEIGHFEGGKVVDMVVFFASPLWG